MTEIVYKIRDKRNYQYVEFITPNTEVVNSTIGRKFNSYGDAITFLNTAQMQCIRNNRYISLNRFEIEELHLTRYGSTNITDFVQDAILNKPDNDEYIGWFRSLLTQSVLDGFQLIKPELLNFALTYDKYQPIMSEIVPPHMLQCIDEFKEVGILGCDMDILGSISLTASEKQITMYNIDELCKSKTDISSK